MIMLFVIFFNVYYILSILLLFKVSFVTMNILFMYMFIQSRTTHGQEIEYLSIMIVYIFIFHVQSVQSVTPPPC